MYCVYFCCCRPPGIAVQIGRYKGMIHGTSRLETTGKNLQQMRCFSDATDVLQRSTCMHAGVPGIPVLGVGRRSVLRVHGTIEGE